MTLKPIIIAFSVLALISGCEDEVLLPEPNEFPYSMWGALNALADTQFVRVFPIETSLSPGDPVPLNAQFTSTDQETGETLAWRDSVIVDAAGLVGHVFYAPFQPEWEHQYRLQITREDGASSWVDVEMPSRLTLVVQEADTSRGVILPAMLEGQTQNLLNSEVEIFVSYVVGFSPPPIQVPIFEFYRHIIPFDNLLQNTGNGYRISIDLIRNYNPVFAEVANQDNFIESEGIRLLSVEFKVLVASEEWIPPGNVFDPNILIQPGTLENVQNGFGFVGGGYRLARSWTLPFDVVEQTDFIPNR